MKTAWAFAFFFLYAAPASGFRLKEHALITRRAVAEITLCLGEAPPDALTRKLVRANLAEDLNLIRKWSRFSHYFHPHYSLPLRRYDSSVRVERLERKLEALLAEPAPNWKRLFSLLGHGLHHVQDMASPSHVVPVSHGPFDGFESLLHLSFFETKAGFIDCERLLEGPSLGSALRETAQATLFALFRELVLKQDGREKTLSFRAFWQGAKGEAYGTYGALGNHFGETSFTHEGYRYQVPLKTYYQWKEAQLKLAIEVSCRVMYPFFIRWRAEREAQKGAALF